MYTTVLNFQKNSSYFTIRDLPWNKYYITYYTNVTCQMVQLTKCTTKFHQMFSDVGEDKNIGLDLIHKKIHTKILNMDWEE